jgi:hypothetical protein
MNLNDDKDTISKLEAEVKRLESYLIVMHGEINSHRRDKKIELLDRIWEKNNEKRRV